MAPPLLCGVFGFVNGLDALGNYLASKPKRRFMIHGGRLQFLSLPFFLLIVFLAQGGGQLKEEALLAWAALQALIYAIPIFLIWNAITAVLGASKRISEKGQWIDGRFIYHVQMQVFTTQFGPKDDGKSVTFCVKDAEPNTLVNFMLEHHGGRGVAGIGHIRMPIHGMGITRETIYGSRIGKKREAQLFFQAPENSDPTIVRVYAVSWET